MSALSWKLPPAGAVFGLAVFALAGFGAGFLTQNPDEAAAKPEPQSSAAINVDAMEIQRIVLTSHDGTSINWGSFSGRYRLVFFGYTFCPDVCPMGLSNLAEVIDLLEEKGMSPDSIFVTVDPKRDTPEVLKEYVTAFHDKLLGLSGKEQQIRKLSEAFKAFYQRSDPDDDSEYYLIDHTSYIYLISPDGSMLGYYPEASDPEDLAEHILAAT